MRVTQTCAERISSVLSAKPSVSSVAKSTSLILIILGCAVVFTSSQTRRRSRTTPAQTPPPRGSAVKYSDFQHSSEKHKALDCNACHKIPTAWTANRDFPDVADFPDHDSCVRCHRPQFFTRQAFIGSGPSICTVCHLRAAPKADARFAFGKPNDSNQTLKTKEERQFTIEFPHDQHQNVIATLRSTNTRFISVAFYGMTSDYTKPDSNSCSFCHGTNTIAVPSGWPEAYLLPANAFKATPHSHDACFNCHWKNEKPASANCAGCHQPAKTFQPANFLKRISARFSHEGGKGEHVLECTNCHINITRARSLRGLTPDVPIAACTTCHKDSKKTTYPKAVTIEEEFEQYKKTGACTYCHSADIGKKKPPASHDAAVQ